MIQTELDFNIHAIAFVAIVAKALLAIAVFTGAA
jgi:hypothetical protein